MDFRKFNPFREKEIQETQSTFNAEVLKFWTDEKLAEELSELKKIKSDIEELAGLVPNLRKHTSILIPNLSVNRSMDRGKKVLEGLQKNYPNIDEQITAIENEINSRTKND